MKVIMTKTPMRMTIAGGGTDVLWYSMLHGGAWISSGLNLFVTVRISDAGRGIPTNDIINECLKTTGVLRKVTINASSDAPPQSGLGGSGAFEVGLLHGLHAYKGDKVTQLQLAREAADIEIVKLKKPVGPQDQYITALGGIRYFEIDTRGNVMQEPLLVSSHTKETLQDNLLFFTTGMAHDTALVLGDQKKKIETRETSKKMIRALDEIKSLGQDVKKWFVGGNVDDVGRSFHTHWLIKRQLSDKVSNSKIDEWYDEAMKAGALGGKIMGAGGGGWFVFYVNKQKNKFRDRMIKIGLVEKQVRFDWKGTRIVKHV